MKQTIRNLSKVEKIIVVFLCLIAIMSGFQIGRAFYLEHSVITPVNGGMYVEGDVGKIGAINPLLVQQGSLSHDIAQLIFSGLTKYDPKTKDIVPDLANYKVSSSGKEYTFVLKDKAKWHDGQPVTADDVIFTYETIIKNPGFKGAILNYNDYSGIKVTKIDDRTVQFLLEKPDSFFPVKTLTGILPKHLLENEPIEFFDTAPFNFMPVGSGRYKFVTQNTFGDRSEVNLEAFDDFYDGPPNIENLIIKIYPTFEDLLKNAGELNGIRNVPTEYSDKVLSKGFVLERYQLPQYVAVFLNNEASKLKGSKIRLALQLGTDKESMIDEIGQHKIIDTPLLEIDQENWVNQYSVSKANGALFDTQWEIPLVKTEEQVSDSETADKDAEAPSEEDKKDETPADTANNSKEEVKPDKEAADKPSETKPAEATNEANEANAANEANEADKPIDTTEVTYITSPNEGKDWKTTNDRVTITGTAPKNAKMIMVDDYELKKFVPGDPGWSYVASVAFDNLKPGDNIYKVYAVDSGDEKKMIDAIKITFGNKTVFTEDEMKKLAEENASAPDLPIRVDKNGEKLVLDLITSDKPEIYGQVAEILKKQWKKIGVDINIEILGSDEFQKRLNKREYDLLIFGQNLGYNLDAYPYWHSSQAKEGGLNLSQFKNFVVDSLLEKARYERDADSRKKTLNDIQYLINQEVPAIFLYSPTYYFGLSGNIQNASFENLATTSDRFACIESWNAKVDRKLKEGTTPLTFFTWIIKQF
jgi:ABC-type transport system substrate-binding protein